MHSIRPRWAAKPVSLAELRFNDHLEKSYRATVERGIRILAVFTEDSTRQTYREQMLDAFPNVSFGSLLKLEFFQGSDHTFTLERDRIRLNALVQGWIAGQRAAQEGSPAA